jgi:BirA family biotin operon repressor/biotin-[acetyl-CoA-carboxylase] ligase
MIDELQLRREQVLAAIVRAGANGVSGEQIARELGCSRASVHRHVEALRKAGTAVIGVHEGYVIDPAADPVVGVIVAEGLRAPILGPVIWSRQTGSTNDDAAGAARAGAAEGLVIGADIQTVGRGRRGRPWETSAHDALTFSVVLRPQVAPVDAGMLPLVVAVAVAEAISPQARIVWPNDIVIDGHKVCGILCESSLDESGIAWAIAGIGINVHGAPELADARWTAGAVGDHRPVTRGALLAQVLTTLADRYAQWQADGAAPIVGAYEARDALAGTGVTVQVAAGPVTGTAAGIDSLGRLRVRTAAGEESLGSGEVTRVEW